MSKGQITKDYFKYIVLKQKNKLNNEVCSEESKKVAHRYLNEIIDIIEEYRF